MSSYEGIEKEKDEFLDYLNQYGVLDQITDVLIMLYNEPEKPSDPIDYVRKNMFPENADVLAIAEMKSLVEGAEVELARLKSTRNELKAKLQRLEKDGGYPVAEAVVDEDDEGDDEGLLQG